MKLIIRRAMNVIVLACVMIFALFYLPAMYAHYYDGMELSVLLYERNPNTFTTYAIQHAWTIAKAAVLCGCLLFGPAASACFGWKKRYGYIMGTATLLVCMTACLFTPAGHMITQNVHWSLLLHILVAAAMTLIIGLSVFFRVIRYCVCGFLGLYTLWGAVLIFVSCLADHAIGDALILIGIALFFWSLLIRYWFVPNSRILRAICTLLQLGMLLMTMITWHLVNWGWLYAILSTLSFICLVIDTVMVFLSHRKAVGSLWW